MLRSLSMWAVRRARSKLPRPSHRAVRLSSALPGDNGNQNRMSLKLPPAVEEVRDRALQAYGILSAGYKRAAATPYGRLMRLDKPAGAQLLFLPCAWGVALGAGSVGDVVGLSALLYGGAVVARGGGCTVNDIWDADVDRSVERTADRPVAAGEVSTPAAVAFASAQFLAGLGVLTTLTPSAFMLGTAVLVPALYYPLAKRVVRYPQAVLAFTFNSGAIIGYAAATDAIALPALALYGSGVCWTMVYDTIYAHQDKRDDRALGLKSTALEFGDNPRNVLAAFGAGQFACLFAAGMLTDLSTPFYMGTAVAAMRVYQQIYNTDLDDPKECGKAFADNTSIGALIWGSILAGRLF